MSTGIPSVTYRKTAFQSREGHAKSKDENGIDGSMETERTNATATSGRNKPLPIPDELLIQNHIVSANESHTKSNSQSQSQTQSSARIQNQNDKSDRSRSRSLSNSNGNRMVISPPTTPHYGSMNKIIEMTSPPPIPIWVSTIKDLFKANFGTLDAKSLLRKCSKPEDQSKKPAFFCLP
jgi:hypothetical protein